MQVLIVSNQLPYPPTSGGEIRTHGIVEGLHQAGHDITLLCFSASHAKSPETIHVHTVQPPAPRSLINRIKTLIFSRQPDIAARFYSPQMEATFRQLLTDQRFDLIQFEGIESAWLLPLAKTLQPQTKVAFDTFNAEYALQRSILEIDRQDPRRWPVALYSWIQSRRIRRYESRLCTLADLVFAVSDEDANLLRPLRPDHTIQVVNSGIWVDQYSDSDSLDLGKNTIVFTGSMGYRPNVDAALWFAQEIFPAVRQSVPDAQFYIVGKEPHSALEPLSQIEGIILTGRVGSVLPYLLGAAVYVAPLRMGSGTRLKLLEAMAARCAIIATRIAAAGLNNNALDSMQITDTPEDMATAIIDLLNNPQKRENLRHQTYNTVRQYYDWSALIPSLLAAYRTIGLEA